jgi:protein-disulfide isomerase
MEKAMFATRRILVLAAGSAALLAACDGSKAATGNSAADITVGSSSARVQLIEYASVTCPHCATFHEEVYPHLKSQYIDTGRVRFTFREYPTSPAQVAVAGFQLARCGNATPEQYITRVGVLMAQQREILGTGTMQGVLDSLVRIGQTANLTPEQVTQCVNDEAGTQRIQKSMQEGDRLGVTGTPTFFLNGTKIQDPSFNTPEGMARILDNALGQNRG